MAVVIPIVVIVLVAAVSMVLLANRMRSSTGALSRETRRRDTTAAEVVGVEPSMSTELEAAGRERAEETREKASGEVPATRKVGAVTRWEPVDEEELGVTRRQFLNRGVLTAVGFAIAGFAPAALAFMWPTGAGGFGSKVKVDKTLSEIFAYIDQNREPYYVAEARTYMQRYPKDALKKGKKVYANPVIYGGMEQGIVALYQRCVHLGCRVPWCKSSQWFECPCHGSKYNAVGEKKAGPAPRGLDRWPIVIDGGVLTVDTVGTPVQGPPIGTDTTGQQQEGPLCV